MGKRLQVPQELESLIEKREADDDRRGEDQRSSGRRGEDLGPLGAIESTRDLREVPTEERRKSNERRQTKNRRAKRRRKSD